MELCIKLMTSKANLPPPEELRRALEGLLACVLNTEFIIFNEKFIKLNEEFIIFIFNAEFIILKQNSLFLMQNSSF